MELEYHNQYCEWAMGLMMMGSISSRGKIFFPSKMSLMTSGAFLFNGPHSYFPRSNVLDV